MITEFKNPDDVYYGTDFWMLNDKLTKEEILFQMNQMYEKGTKTVLARTYSGLISDYPGENFKNDIRFIVETAEKIGMKIYLQAKYMPECVPNIPQKYAMHHVMAVKKDQQYTGKLISSYGEYNFVMTVSDSILDVFNAASTQFYIKECYEDMWKDFSKYFGNVIPSIWVDEPAFGRTNLPWPKNMEMLFKQRWGYDISPHIHKMWFGTDDYKKVRYHYRTLLRDLFEENYFKRIRKWCDDHNLKFSGHLLGEDSLKAQVRCSVAVMPYYKYFDIPGIDILTIHAEWNDDPIKQKPGDELCDYQRLYTTPLQIMSAANQTGNDANVLCEMYGASTENMTFKNQRYLFDHLASFGINHRSVHGIFYSLRGRRKRGYAPHISYHQPYWEKYKKMYEYCARVSMFIRNGKSVADVLIVHPIETCYTMLDENLPEGSKNSEISEYDVWFFTTLLNLKAAHCEFELGDFSTMRDMGKITFDNKFCVGLKEYKAVVLPRIDVLSKEVFELLKIFSNNGGRIICMGNPPSMLDGESYNFENEIKFEYVNDTAHLSKIMNEVSDSYEINGTDNAAHIMVNHRKNENTDFFMLTNTDCAHSKNIVLSVKGERKVVVCDAESGAQKEMYADFDGERTCYEFNIDSGSSILILFEQGKCDTKKEIIGAITSINLNNNWQIKRNNDNVLLLEYCRYKKQGEEFSNEMPVLAANELLYQSEYKGKIFMEFCFETDFVVKNLKLALEDVGNAKIHFNGIAVSTSVTDFYIDKSFSVINLPDICIKGKNIITVEKEYTPLNKTSKNLASIFETSDGTELECMYLLGDFKVNVTSEHSLNGCIRLNRNFVITKNTYKADIDNLVCGGYPFYAGCIELTNKFDIPDADKVKKLTFSIDSLRAAVAEVYLNGNYIGDITRGYAELDCTKSILEGENTICIKLLNTLRNLFGPSHRPIGERGNTFGDTSSRKRGCYGYFDEPWIPMDTSVDKWYEKIDVDTNLWSSSYFLLAFGVNGAKINIESL